METVERLTREESLMARPMWSEIFFEDSDVFTDYYFAEKMGDNTGYGLKCGGQLRAMLFLTPYTGCIFSPDAAGRTFCDVPLCYIVGVGTKKEYRHRGYMDRLLRTALADLYEAGQPFAFLMPADPAIYTPYQFRYVYDRPVFSVRRRKGTAAEPMQPGEEEALAEFAQKRLEERYQVFLRRDASYYKRQKKESLAQNGDVYVWKEDGEIAGFYLYANEGGKEEIQEAVVSDALAGRGVLEISGRPKPIIMARIINVPAMLSLMRLSQQSERERVSITLRLVDALLARNNGTFLWTVGRKESTIALLEKADSAEVCVEVGDLTEFLFGRKSCRDCFAEMAGAAAPAGEAAYELRAAGLRPGGTAGESASAGERGDVFERLSAIQVLPGLFLNEIV